MKWALLGTFSIGIELLASFARGWIVMLCLGDVHHYTGWPCAIGYWPSYLIAIAVNIASWQTPKAGDR